jgi:hypothetical protein
MVLCNECGVLGCGVKGKRNGSNFFLNVLLVVMAFSCGLGLFYCNWIFLSINWKYYGCKSARVD